MKRYDNYKDSGVQWLGEIPKHWNVTKLKFIGNAIGGLTYTPNDIVEDETNGKLVLRSSNIQNGKLSLDDNVYVKTDISEKLTLKKGDILICSRNGSQHLIGKNICIDERTEGHTFGAFMMIFRSKYYSFLNHFFNSPIFTSQSGLFLTATINQLTSGTLNNFYIALPETIDEQTAISNFLDNKTAQIDSLIAKKEELIQLLEEERTAIINQAVTKGLDPAVPMKDSGIEWLGEIPEGWDRARIKTLVSIKVSDGPHETPEWTEEGIPFISAEAIKGNQIDLNYKRGYISKEQHIEYCKKSKVLKGDILFCKSGSTTGKSAMVEIDDDFGIWSPLAIIRVDQNKISNGYMFQSIQSSLFKNQVETSWTFGTQPNIGMGAIENLWIAIPPLSEQEEIDLHLKNELSRFDLILVKTQQEIEYLKEYKIALISEVVTGKVDVSTALNTGVRNEKLN